jgi:hypothetical protein
MYQSTSSLGLQSGGPLLSSRWNSLLRAYEENLVTQPMHLSYQWVLQCDPQQQIVVARHIVSIWRCNSYIIQRINLVSSGIIRIRLPPVSPSYSIRTVCCLRYFRHFRVETHPSACHRLFVQIDYFSELHGVVHSSHGFAFFCEGQVFFLLHSFNSTWTVDINVT